MADPAADDMMMMMLLLLLIQYLELSEFEGLGDEERTELCGAVAAVAGAVVVRSRNREISGKKL
jgi:hypothetical protein